MSSDSSAAGTRRRMRFGKYEVVQHIATGGMGAVYRAIDTTTQQEVAVKVLTAEAASKPALLERFRREARNAAKLQHENIVKVFEFGETNGTHFIAMELVEGIDLHDHIEASEMLDPEESRQIMIQATRALAHAYSVGIVHRDIKPSNFLLTKKDGRLLVKLTDLGLAREVISEEFRVTRAGTTVGTVDYISPEQARDSGAADVRSDMYSLGCTWYHMLTGQPPFNKGGLAERLIKHMEEEPADVRKVAPRVSDELVAVLNKLLAKKPEDRYQEPRELLHALLEMSAIRAERPAQEQITAKKGRRIEKPATGGKKRKRGDEAKTRSPVAPSLLRKKRQLLLIAGALLALLLVGGGILAALAWRGSGPPAPPDEQTVVVPPPDETIIRPIVVPTPPQPPTPTPDPPTPSPAEVVYPVLYRPLRPIPGEELARQVEEAWKDREPVTDGPVFRVTRLAGAQADQPTFATLEQAIAAAPENKTTVIEIHDGGPLYVASSRVADRSLVLRTAGNGRSLVVWDVEQAWERRKAQGAEAGPGGLSCLRVERGRLHLERIDVVVKWPTRATAGADSILEVRDGDLHVQGCTFSATGKHSNGLRLARVENGEGKPARCRISRCYSRGDILGVLALSAVEGEVLVEDSLLVGGQPTLLRFEPGKEKATTVRVVRSTLVAGRCLVEVSPRRGDEGGSMVHWVGWDSVLSRSGKSAEGDLLRLDQGADTRTMKWDAYNCLYAGWPQLLNSDEARIPNTDIDAWRRAWGRVEGDVAQRTPWPNPPFADPEDKPASRYDLTETVLCFSSSSGRDKLLGCPLDGLPGGTDAWLPLTYDRYASPPVLGIVDAAPPEIPLAVDGRYHGEKIDLGQAGMSDLGAYLERVQRTKELASRVVLHLTGSGEKSTSPIRVRKGTSLVLYFEPVPEDGEPLTLRLSSRSAEGEGLIEVEGGGLDILNGRLRLGGSGFGRTAPYLVRVKEGAARLWRTRLEAPLPCPLGFRALLGVSGSGQTEPAGVLACVLTSSVLVSGQTGIHIDGIGAKVQLRDSLVAAEGHAVELAPGKGYQGKANLFCTLDQTTVAAREAVLFLVDPEHGGAVQEPIVVQTTRCAFLNPFPAPPRAGMLLFATGQALERGALIWQSEQDVFDSRLGYALARQPGGPEKGQEQTEWQQILGSPGLREPQLNAKVAGDFPDRHWSLDKLALPRATSRGEVPAGADLKQLGLLRTKSKPR